MAIPTNVPPEADQAPLTEDRFAPANRRRLSGPALRTFLNIARAWGMSEAQKRAALGFPARSTYYKWTADVQAGRAVTLPTDTLLRISAVLGIYKDLRIIFGDNGAEWIHSSNEAPCFGGQKPIDLVAGGAPDGIFLVRRYLDAWRGGVFSAPREGLPTAWDADDVVVVD